MGQPIDDDCLFTERISTFHYTTLIQSDASQVEKGFTSMFHGVVQFSQFIEFGTLIGNDLPKFIVSLGVENKLRQLFVFIKIVIKARYNC